MKRRSLLASAALAPLAFSPIARAQGPLKVGFVYVGPVGDHGWTYQHDQGRQAVDATLKVAEQFPNVAFEHCTGYKRAANVSTYSSRFYEGRYIIGQIGARMTKTGRIGHIASFPIPEVIRGANAAILGAHQQSPGVTLQVVWVNTWYDPGREADAAKALIGQGCDVIMQHTDSPAALQVAEEEGVKAFGQASDMARFAPTAQLTAIIDNWAPYYIERVRAVLEGRWQSQDSWGGLAANEVVMAPYANMPEDVAQMARRVEADVRSGARHPFEGPVYDRAGVERIPSGQVPSDADLLSMNWFAEGISGELPS